MSDQPTPDGYCQLQHRSHYGVTDSTYREECTAQVVREDGPEPMVWVCSLPAGHGGEHDYGADVSRETSKINSLEANRQARRRLRTGDFRGIWPVNERAAGRWLR